MRRYKVLGTTEDYDGCDCCGRANLKVYVVMEDLETGEICYFGTGCAAKLEKIPHADMRREAREADEARRVAEQIERNRRNRIQDAAWQEWLDAHSSATERIDQIRECGGIGVARAAFREEWDEEAAFA